MGVKGRKPFELDDESIVEHRERGETPQGMGYKGIKSVVNSSNDIR